MFRSTTTKLVIKHLLLYHLDFGLQYINNSKATNNQSNFFNSSTLGRASRNFLGISSLRR